MANTVLVGAQWGDEGKGKIIDVLTPEVDVIVRYQGGNNAGHTVKIGDDKYVLHLLPAGMLHEGKQCVIGNGVVVDPTALAGELNELRERGIEVGDRLRVSDRAHVVFPYHGALDAAREAACRDDKKIGTTKRGIGPTYGDKMSRVGLRMGDLLDPAFPQLLTERMHEVNRVLEALGAEPVDTAKLITSTCEAVQVVEPFIGDSIAYLGAAVRDGKSILFEGAQGTMLDIDFGSYPFVTSSNATAGGACTGTGVPPNKIDRVLGVIKTYTTRVGEGPFPTELHDDVGDLLAREGNEFGATTGRARRCGWFDAVLARYAAMINGFDVWAMTKLDVLDKLETIKICVAYECDGKRYDTVPANIRVLEQCTPVYEEMPGWQTPTSDVTEFDALPQAARDYVNYLVALTGVQLGVLSVGAQRKSTLRIGM